MKSNSGLKGTFLKKTWTLRLISAESQKSVVLKIKPMHIMVILFIAVCVFFVAIRDFNHKLKTSEVEIKALKAANEQQQLHIEKLRAEKLQMAGLVDKQNLELGDKLRDIEQKNSQIRKIVGLKTAKKELDVTHRRVIKANRGALAYKSMEKQTDSIFKEIGSSEKEVDLIEREAIAYKEEMARKERAKSAMPSIWPCQGYISSEFGFRIHPVYGYSRYHSGLDIATSYGEPIYSAAAGVVIESGYNGGYGNCLKVDHGNGLVTLYGHCSSLLVNQGEYVTKGQMIARVGSTGVSTGPHLHYEVLSGGVPINPARYLN